MPGHLHIVLFKAMPKCTQICGEDFAENVSNQVSMP